jgi:hypothetical protein
MREYAASRSVFSSRPTWSWRRGQDTVRERAEDQEPVLCCEGKGKEGVDEAAGPLGMFCQEGHDERGSAKRHATSHHARLGVANAQLLCHLLSSHRVMSIHAALGQLHVEANGGSQVAEGAEGSGSVSGRALQVAVIGKGEGPCLGMELLGLLQGGLKGEAKHQHATRVALAYPALREEGPWGAPRTKSRVCWW